MAVWLAQALLQRTAGKSGFRPGIDDAVAFFTELGLTLEGRAMIEGE
jgi:hypothetical protein